jgi:hypothetical protein
VGFAMASGILPFFAQRMKAGYQHTNEMASIVAKELILACKNGRFSSKGRESQHGLRRWSHQTD